MGNIALTTGTNVGLTPRKLRQTLGGQGGQEITAYVPDPTRFTGVQGTEYAQGQAPNLQYVPDTIYKQYKDAQGNLFELVPSQNPGGLSDPGTYLRQLSGAPQGYAQTPQQIIQQSNNLPQGWEQDIYGAVKKTEYLNILPGETEQAYYKRTGVGYSPAFGGKMPGPQGLSNVQAPAMTQAGSTVPTSQSIQAGIDSLLKRIQSEGITGPKGEVLLAPGSLATQGGQPIASIVADKLGGETTKAIDVSGTTPTGTGTDATSMFAGAEEWIKQWEKLNASADATGQSKVDSMLADIENKYGELLGKGNAQAEAEKQAGIDTMKKNIADINAQIYTKLAEAKARQAEYLKLNTSIEGKAISMSSIIGSQAQVNKMALAEQNAAASDIGILQSQVQAMTGSLAVAQDTINRAIDLKYQGILDDISVRKAQIDIIQGQLDKKDKLKADAISAYLDSQQTAINDAKSTAKTLATLTTKNIFDYPSAGIQQGDSEETQRQKILKSVEYKAELKKESGGGESVVDIRQQRNDLADLLAQVATYASREQATSELDNYKSSIIARIGEEGFNKIQQEVDRKFPPPKPEETIETKPTKSIFETVTGAVSGFFNRLFQQ